MVLLPKQSWPKLQNRLDHRRDRADSRGHHRAEEINAPTEEQQKALAEENETTIRHPETEKSWLTKI